MSRLHLALLGGLLLTPLPAAATTAPTLTLAQQAKKAEVIVRATLGTPVPVQDGNVTYVAYPLTVTEAVLGDPARLPQHEGKPALLVLQGLQDLPALQAGQEVLALLYARRLDSPLVGFNQGLYVIQNGVVVSAGLGQPGDLTDPVKLRDAIRAARESQ